VINVIINTSISKVFINRESIEKRISYSGNVILYVKALKTFHNHLHLLQGMKHAIVKNYIIYYI